MKHPIRSFLLAAAIAFALSTTTVHAEPFTFQGFLQQSGTPLNGSANLVFKLYDAQTSGSQIGSTLTATAWPVAAGLFTIDLDFTGVVFTGAERWLQIEVDGTPLDWRIAIQPAPLASSANALRGFNVLGSTPSNGQVLKWNGAAWAPAADSGGSSYSAGIGLTLSGSTFSANFAGSGVTDAVSRSDHGHFGVEWSGVASEGVTVTNSSADMASSAIFGRHIGSANAGAGVKGVSTSASGVGVYGDGFRGVWGNSSTSGFGAGVYGWRYVPGGAGVQGHASGDDTTVAVRGENVDAGGDAIVGSSSSSGAGDGIGVLGKSLNTAGTGVRGEATATTGDTIGVHGSSASPSGTGVKGEGRVGVEGDGHLGVVGMVVDADDDAVGVMGVGIHPTAALAGVFGQVDAPQGYALKAVNLASSGSAYGAYALSNSPSGTAIVGDALSATGSNRGVLARTASSNGIGLRAENTTTSGAGSGNALVAVGNLPSGDTMLVEANGSNSAWAIRARSAGSQVINAQLTSATTTGSAISASANTATGRAGYFVNNATGGQAAQFVGNVDVSGTLSKGGGSFKIDHPLDPANKYLLHSFVESPDMMNVYNGNIVTDANGRATVELPDWFETLNRDFRYQLTVIGEFAQVMVSKKIEQGHFEIRSSIPDVEISWQVTGIRQDPWAELNRIPVELDKAAADRGRYLHPEAWGQPRAKAIGLELRDDKSGASQ